MDYNAYGTTADAPTHEAPAGLIWVTSEGVIYQNIGGTTWQKVEPQ